MRKVLLLVCVCCMLLGTGGCNYGSAVAQNLSWGLGGFVESVLVNGDLSGAGAWVSGALVNALIHGKQ